MLFSLSHIAAPATIFEFGTYLGITARFFRKNHPDASVVTIDLDEHSAEDASVAEADRVHVRNHLKRDAAIRSDKLVTFLSGDSNGFDPTPFAGTQDFILIDGGHDAITVRNDTEKSLVMLSDRPKSCLVWHDYTEPKHPDVTAYLDDLSLQGEFSFFHVDGTRFCFVFRGEVRPILSIS